MKEGSLSTTCSPALILCRFFDDGRSEDCEEIPPCSFDLHFSNHKWHRASFHVFISHLYVFFGEICLGLFPTLLLGCLFFWYLSYMSCLYILEINPLSVVSFVIIFSHSEGYLFTLFIVSFAVQKLLSLIRSHLFIFVFISITLGCGSKRILLWFMSKKFLPMFSPKTFSVQPYIYLLKPFLVYFCVWC